MKKKVKKVLISSIILVIALLTFVIISLNKWNTGKLDTYISLRLHLNNIINPSSINNKSIKKIRGNLNTQSTKWSKKAIPFSGIKNFTIKQFATILGGKITESKPGSCSVEKDRDNLNVTIWGIPAKSVLNGEFIYQGMNSSGKALNLGEIVVLQDELNSFLTVLKRNGIDIAAVHNHWIYDNPRILYVHFQSIDNPLNFARKVAEALKVLK